MGSRRGHSSLGSVPDGQARLRSRKSRPFDLRKTGGENHFKKLGELIVTTSTLRNVGVIVPRSPGSHVPLSVCNFGLGTEAHLQNEIDGGGGGGG